MRKSRRGTLKLLAGVAATPPLAYLASTVLDKYGNPTDKSSNETTSVQTIEEIDTQTEQKLVKREESLKDQLVVQESATIKSPHEDYADDIYLSPTEFETLKKTVRRLAWVQKQVGFGNFNLISFDRALAISNRVSGLGPFIKDELNFMEDVFSRDAKSYGFLGDKVIANMTHAIPKSSAIKVPYTGHYLFTGDSYRFYKKIRKDVGEKLILTSGVRSPMKQMYLYLAKALRVDGNLSRASRSLAPPGYSFHGSGDFDVGRIGLGAQNFTEAFAKTDEFKKLSDLGYISIRYFNGNRLGVRYEPWHIQLS